MNILIIGPQGSGKGTQAKLLAEKKDLFLVESGAILREAALKNPAIDEVINKKGQLLPDEETFSLIKGWVEAGANDLNDLLFDGFPRSTVQYDLLKEWFHEKGIKLDKVFLLEISKEETIRRLSSRLTCDKCGRVYNTITNPPPAGGCECGGALSQRQDDTPQAIETRLSFYDRITTGLVEQLDKEGILVRINGERPIEVISQEILSYL